VNVVNVYGAFSAQLTPDEVLLSVSEVLHVDLDVILHGFTVTTYAVRASISRAFIFRIAAFCSKT
jgi:hypothetical protein